MGRLDRADIHSLEAVHNIFITEYADAAGCSAYATGYANRGNNAYQYVAGLDLSSYGVPANYDALVIGSYSSYTGAISANILLETPQVVYYKITGIAAGTHTINLVGWRDNL